jgi:hypothetical protein
VYSNPTIFAEINQCHTTLALSIKSYKIIFLLYFVDTATSQWYFLLYNTELSETKLAAFWWQRSRHCCDGDSFSAFREVAEVTFGPNFNAFTPKIVFLNADFQIYHGIRNTMIFQKRISNLPWHFEIRFWNIVFRMMKYHDISKADFGFIIAFRNPF